jgi:catechol 2,3-dioxygenase
LVESFGIQPDGFRLPRETRLGPVALQVGDLDRSLAYYERVLGLRAAARSGDSVALTAQDDDRPLVNLIARAGLRPLPRRGVLGLFHFAIVLPERAALGRFVSHLTSLGVNAGTADHFVSEAIYLSDPDDLGIEIYADRPRGAWRTDGRQLLMTTEPLDVGDLMAAGGGQPWSGMPSGTAMGHVHLHVGDLDQASAFYHSALGFDKTVWGYPGALFFSAGGYHHHLATNTWVSGPPAAEDQPRLLSWNIVVPRAEQASAAAQSLKSAGYDVARCDGGWSATDPWGTPLVIRAAS